MYVYRLDLLVRLEKCNVCIVLDFGTMCVCESVWIERCLQRHKSEVFQSRCNVQLIIIQLMGRLIDASINRSFNQSTDRPTDRPMSEWTDRSINYSTDWPIDRSMDRGEFAQILSRVRHTQSFQKHSVNTWPKSSALGAASPTLLLVLCFVHSASSTGK